LYVKDLVSRLMPQALGQQLYDSAILLALLWIARELKAIATALNQPKQ
jgi:hypothetical protein